MKMGNSHKVAATSCLVYVDLKDKHLIKWLYENNDWSFDNNVLTNKTMKKKLVKILLNAWLYNEICTNTIYNYQIIFPTQDF